MESMNYYYHEHELLKANLEKYNIQNFDELPIEPEIIGYTKYKNIQYPKYDLYNVAGTVLDRDKNKHLVTLLTTNGVITVKFYSGQFSFYDKTISIDDGIDEKTGKNKKTTLEDGWFKRGNLLLITGFRRENNFYPKRYKNSVAQHTVQLIKEIKDNGDLILQSDRIYINE
jgi:DNA polymerase-3 subunit alpha